MWITEQHEETGVSRSKAASPEEMLTYFTHRNSDLHTKRVSALCSSTNHLDYMETSKFKCSKTWQHLSGIRGILQGQDLPDVFSATSVVQKPSAVGAALNDVLECFDPGGVS